MNLSDFVFYKNAWIKKDNLSLSKKIKKEEAKSLLKSKGWYVRNIYQWDNDEVSSFWYIIKDQFGGIEELPSKVRNQVRKSLKTFDFRIVPFEEMLEVGYSLFNKSRERFVDNGGALTQEQWKQKIGEKNMEFWLGYDKESGKAASLAIVTLYSDYVDYTTMGISPDFPNSTYPMYGLIFEMNRYYLEEKKYPFICDGSRSITEHSGFQPFLVEKFKFRKAYCNLQIFYKPWLRFAVNLLFPIRKIITNKKVTAILNQEAMFRGEK